MNKLSDMVSVGVYAIINERGHYMRTRWADGTYWTRDHEKARTWKTSAGVKAYLDERPEMKKVCTVVTLRRPSRS